MDLIASIVLNHKIIRNKQFLNFGLLRSYRVILWVWWLFVSLKLKARDWVQFHYKPQLSYGYILIKFLDLTYMYFGQHNFFGVTKSIF